MIERYIEISCDVCGDPEWTQPGESAREFFAGNGRQWRRNGKLHMCPGCSKAGRKWSEATLHNQGASCE